MHCIYYYNVKHKVTSLNNTITHYKSLNRINKRMSPLCKILSKSYILTVQFYFLNTPRNAQWTLRKSTNKQPPSPHTTSNKQTPLCDTTSGSQHSHLLFSARPPLARLWEQSVRTRDGDITSRSSLYDPVQLVLLKDCF